MESVINFGRFLAIISLNVIVTLFSLFQLHVFWVIRYCSVAPFQGDFLSLSLASTGGSLHHFR